MCATSVKRRLVPRRSHCRSGGVSYAGLVGLRTWIVPLAGRLGPAKERPVAGQRQSAPPAAGLVRTTTRLVQISVIVTDKKGELLEDLTRADFVVLDNGRPQEIQIFQRETNQRPANPSFRLPPDTYTNQIHKAGKLPPSVTMLSSMA
jgi:hypothetical protein